ncbi:hypothetical protein LAZ67_1000361 [Cordylochernes scorpioides]|uniref:Integrase catalytic domain-containing protein n=1 Tax=Cordylochernes scorpioides TaxID=51811 RepID=A0ABY6JUN3_9ARAC|nr:hypothetical protein LAZ67_1000361 [Cordylochernes scorpioides]
MPPATISEWTWPEKPWHRLHLDLADNGRQFVSGEFEQFTKINGIRHTKTSPYNPSTNGLAERYVREFENLLRKNNGKDDLETNLQSFLFAHRAFPQTVIKEFPGGTANEEKFKIKILEFNTKMGNPREVFHEAVRRQEQFTTGCEVYFRNYATGPKRQETSSAVFARANYCSKDKIGRFFLHRIVTGDEKWIHYDNPKRRKSSVKPGHASTSTAKPTIHGKKLMLCIWWDQLGVIYYELLQPNETITGERYQQQLMRLSLSLKIKRPLYAKRHDKVIYQHDNARPHVAKVAKETMEALQWDALPHPLYSPDIAPSDYHMFRSMTHGLAEQHFTSYEEAKNWVNIWIASKDEEFFRHGIRMLPERWEKVVAKDGQYFE